MPLKRATKPPTQLPGSNPETSDFHCTESTFPNQHCARVRVILPPPGNKSGHHQKSIYFSITSFHTLLPNHPGQPQIDCTMAQLVEHAAWESPATALGKPHPHHRTAGMWKLREHMDTRSIQGSHCSAGTNQHKPSKVCPCITGTVCEVLHAPAPNPPCTSHLLI